MKFTRKVLQKSGLQCLSHIPTSDVPEWSKSSSGLAEVEVRTTGIKTTFVIFGRQNWRHGFWN